MSASAGQGCNDSRPVPGLFEESLRNPREVSSTTYSNAPSRVAEGLAAHNATTRRARSRRIGRVLLLTEPPSINGNERTDKGYINQKARLTRRTALVVQLYAEPPAADVLFWVDGPCPACLTRCLTRAGFSALFTVWLHHKKLIGADPRTRYDQEGHSSLPAGTVGVVEDG